MKFIYKKIELWVIFLLVLKFFLFVIFFGSVLRHHYLGGTSLKSVQDIFVFIAEIPHNIKNPAYYEIVNRPNNLLRHQIKPKYKRFKNDKIEALIVLPRYVGHLNRAIVEVRDLQNFELLHTYSHDINKMWSQVDDSRPEHKRLNIDHQEIRFEYRHPIILNDGSLIASSEYSPLFKLDLCSNLLWINDEERFHHSKMIDHNGNIWVSAQLFPYSQLVSKYMKQYGFRDDSISLISPQGKILFNKSVSSILVENGIVSEDSLFLNNDPVHLNDIEPILEDGKFWRKGDLFLSLRSLNMIILYRPSNNKVIEMIKGPFYMQHDVDILDNERIIFFNNNNSVLNDKKTSQIMIYDFESKNFTKLIQDSLNKDKVKTTTQGLIEVLKDGSIIVEENNDARLIHYNTNGQKIWEYVNKDDNNEIYFISWSRVIEDKNHIKSLKEMIKDKKC